MKEINQVGPMFFKHIMTEVASNPSPEAEAAAFAKLYLGITCSRRSKKSRTT
jgi:hypothetical protein